MENADPPAQRSARDSRLTAVVIRLNARTPISPVHGRFAHAAFLQWIKESDPAVAKRLHTGQRPRPFSLAVLPSIGGAGNELLLRAAFLDHALFETFVERLRPDRQRPVLRLGDTFFDIQETSALPSRLGWSNQTTWSALAGSGREDRRISLEFATPTAFSLGERDSRKRLLLFPLPEALWENWARRWNEHGGDPVSVQAVGQEASRSALVADYALHTQTLDLGRFRQKGFVGTVRYDLGETASPEMVQRMNALADFAFYCGTGSKTAMGCGLTRRLPVGEEPGAHQELES